MSNDGDDGAAVRYPSVFSTVRLGQLEIKNRIFVPAHTTNFGENHLPSDRHLSYHEARARGGAGLIIFEGIRVHRSTLGKVQGIAGYDRRCIAPFRRIAAAVHEHGARLFGQIVHLGREIDGDQLRVAPWGASPIPWHATAPLPHEMDDGDVEALIAGHVTAARNLLEAGLDGIEVHLGHGHLLQQFLSPASNRRTDGYGGSEPNRMRLAIEVLTAVRSALGPDACVGIRISADEYVSGGLTVADMERIAPSILDRVQLDFVNVSHSAYHGSYSLATQMADMSFPEAPFRDLARRMRRALRSHGVPTMAVCKFRSLDEAEDVLRRGDADLVGMARAHIADPNLVRKALDHTETSRPCIGCNQGCAGFLEKGLPITCLVNPTVGREARWTPEPRDDPAQRARRIVVVGAGPAGLEAAWVAAARGHIVELWDRSDEPGGQLKWLRRMPLRRDFLRLIDHQLDLCRRHEVTLAFERDADATSVARRGADAVIIAVGAREEPVHFDGGGTGLTIGEALARPWELGSSIAFHDAIGSWSSLSVVEHLARVGKEVTVFVPAASFAQNITRYSRPALASRLQRLGVRLSLGKSIRAVDGGRVSVEDVWSGEVERAETFDSVVAAGHGRSRHGLRRALDEAGVPTRSVGDCVAPRSALEAVFEGHAIAREL